MLFGKWWMILKSGKFWVMLSASPRFAYFKAEPPCMRGEIDIWKLTIGWLKGD